MEGKSLCNHRIISAMDVKIENNIQSLLGAVKWGNAVPELKGYDYLAH